MSKQDTIYAWLGWIIAAAIVVLFVFYLTNSDENSTVKPASADSSAQFDEQNLPAENSTPQADASWHCVDATSYNHNAYDDNKCTKGSEVQYVSDSQAESLDSDYSPGKAGASYYNNQ